MGMKRVRKLGSADMMEVRKRRRVDDQGGKGALVDRPWFGSGDILSSEIMHVATALCSPPLESGCRTREQRSDPRILTAALWGSTPAVHMQV